MTKTRVRSPRCPSISLEDAIGRTEAIYSEHNKHAVAVDAVAQAMKYKNSNNGAARRTIASLTYFGLLSKSDGGKLSVSQEFEKYKFAPDQSTKSNFLLKWLRTPKVFAELLDRYGEKLPGDAALKYELISTGFAPDSAEDATKLFRESLDFIKRNGAQISVEPSEEEDDDDDIEDCDTLPATNSSDNNVPQIKPVQPSAKPAYTAPSQSADSRPIPIFLPKGREAMLHVPRPFYDNDRKAIIRQLEALLTDDE
jgi:hypothetical protein